MNRTLSTFSLAVLVVGCGSPSPQEPDASTTAVDAAATPDAPEMPDASPPPDAPPPEPDAAPEEVVDCAAIPDAPTELTVLGGPRGYHGLVISQGYMIGGSGDSLIRSTYAGTGSVFASGVGSGEQLALLSDGDLVFARNDNTLARIMSNGGDSVLASSVDAYGVTVGLDKKVYAADTAANRIVRVDPNTGQMEILATNTMSGTFKAVEFSPDSRRLYISTLGGNVYYFDLDASLNVVGVQNTLATGIGTWHDAVAVDACGNLYVPEFFSRNIYRISPSGDVEEFYVQPASDQYTHGLIFGTGKYGWKADALYGPQPYNGNKVMELVIGVPSRAYTGTVVNKPPMAM